MAARALPSTSEVNWQKNASCSLETAAFPHLGNAWIDENSSSRAIAKDICDNICLVKLNCLQNALRDPSAEGMRAGIWFHGGAINRTDVRTMRENFGIVTARINRMSTKDLSA